MSSTFNQTEITVYLVGGTSYGALSSARAAASAESSLSSAKSVEIKVAHVPIATFEHAETVQCTMNEFRSVL